MKNENNNVPMVMKPREVKRAFDYLSEVLSHHPEAYVYLDTNSYRTFFSHFTNSREYSHRLTWNEALRLHSYLKFYIDRNKKTTITITTEQIRNFPIYGLNVKGERKWDVKEKETA